MKTITTHYQINGITLCGINAKATDVLLRESTWFNAMKHKCKKCELICKKTKS